MKTSFITSLTLILLLFCITSCSTDYRTKTEDQREQEKALRYNIKNIREYKSTFQFGVEQKPQLSNLKNFDEDGIKRKETAYSDGNIQSITTFEYDKNDNLITKNGMYQDSSFLFKITQNYYENNLRKEYYFYLPNGTYKYRNLATYDDSGRMTELKYYWPTGIKSINKYQYRGDKKTEDVEYSPTGEFKYRWIYKYDNRDNLVEAVQYYPDSIINGKNTYEYDSGKLLIKQVNYLGESVQNIFIFTYNDKKLVASETEMTSSGTIYAKYTYEYDYY